MSLDELTNPYLLGYLVIIGLLLWLCAGMRRMHLENVDRLKQKKVAAEVLKKSQDQNRLQ